MSPLGIVIGNIGLDEGHRFNNGSCQRSITAVVPTTDLFVDGCRISCSIEHGNETNAVFHWRPSKNKYPKPLTATVDLDEYHRSHGLGSSSLEKRCYEQSIESARNCPIDYQGTGILTAGLRLLVILYHSMPTDAVFHWRPSKLTHPKPFTSFADLDGGMAKPWLQAKLSQEMIPRLVDEQDFRPPG